MLKLINDNSLSALRMIDSTTVQTCVTSPPYWGLRDYGHNEQLGLELTPEKYIENLVEIFKEVHRVLKDEGTLWLNLGDTYFGGGNNRGNTKPLSNKQASNKGAVRDESRLIKWEHEYLKRKDLIGIPWRVALALQKAGWYLRQDIIWHKPNPMPESVTDRCTKAHEYIFLLSKSSKYYFNSKAIKEPVSANTVKRLNLDIANQKGSNRVPFKTNGPMKAVGNKETRNKRSVWTVTTKPFNGAHFATFPPDLIEPCILAGSKEGDIVLDPFMGSGTTGLVARKHNRRFVGIDVNADYVEIAETRIKNANPTIEIEEPKEDQLELCAE